MVRINIFLHNIDHVKFKRWKFSESSSNPFNKKILNTNMHTHFCCWRPTSEGKMLLCNKSIVLKSSHITQVQCNNCNVRMFYGCCRFTITTLFLFLKIIKINYLELRYHNDVLETFFSINAHRKNWCKINVNNYHSTVIFWFDIKINYL